MKDEAVVLILSALVTRVVEYLSDDRVMAFLGRVSDEILDWARKRLAATRRLPHKFAEVIGQRALERKIAGLAEVVEKVFATAPPDVLASFRAAVDEIRQALAVAKALSLVKRKRMHFKIDDKIDELELLLANAVLSAAVK